MACGSGVNIMAINQPVLLSAAQCAVLPRVYGELRLRDTRVVCNSDGQHHSAPNL